MATRDEINSFFGADEIKEFTGELNDTKKDYDPEKKDGYSFTEDDPEEVEYQDVPKGETEETLHYTGADIATARFALTFIDDTRAVVASMYSGAEKDKYLFYKGISDNDPIMQAAAQVVRKHQMTLSPEWILGIALVTSSLIVAGQARNDRNKKDEVDKKDRKKSGKEQPVAVLKPIA